MKTKLYCFITILLFSFGFSKAQLTANFSSSVISGCAPLVIQFTDLSTGGPTSWNWTFGNGNSSPNQNPQAIYTNPGVYTVQLAVSNGSTISTKTKTITVYNKPAANFNINPNPTCAGQNVLFTDQTAISPGGQQIATWAWDFGDGTTQNTTTGSIGYTYTTAGTFPVSLIVTDPNGCSNSITKNITITPFPTPTFSALPTFKCAPPLQVNFTNNSGNSASASIKWLFGDGTFSTDPNPAHTYTTFGSFDVSLIISQGGCTDTLTLQDKVVIQTLNASFTTPAASVCAGRSLTFTNNSNPAAVSSTWNFGDGGTSNSLNPTHLFATAGTFPITMIATDANGCADTIVNNITVGQVPTVNFTANTTQSCSVPFNVIFTNTATGGNTYSWNFGDGGSSNQPNPIHTYNTAGTYPVTLTVGSAGGACVDSLKINNYIQIIRPQANFEATPDSGCVPLNVSFTSTSTSPLDPITTYQWNFGNNSTSIENDPNSGSTYSSVGIFTQTLIVTTQSGCRDTFECENCVRAGTLPTSDFTIDDDTICYNQLAFLFEEATGETGYKWLFGDGGNSLTNNPSYLYQDTGTFQIKLIAFNNGCADTSEAKQIRIDGPKARGTKTMNCLNYYNVLLESTSAIADSVFWNFGDGTQDLTNTATINHLYATRGPKVVTLEAYNFTTGCADTVTINLTVAEPIAEISVDTTRGCFPFAVDFNGSVSQDASTYSWNFGVLNSTSDVSTQASPQFTYQNIGSNTVKLVITDVNGCKDSTTLLMNTLGPNVGFISDTIKGCSPLQITFTDTTVALAPITNWEWQFGDGNSINGNNTSAQHVYAAPGSYNVTLTVTDADGCIKNKTISSLIRVTYPFPNISVDTFLCATDVLLIDATGTNTTASATYLWDFGDGTSVDSTSGPVLNHNYSADGIYNLSLTVTDENGCDSTISKNIYILKPVADFGVNIINSGCGTLQVAFSDSSTGYVTQTIWDFGNGAASSQQNPAYTYTQPGIYDVSLIVTNGGGCKDTLLMEDLITVEGATGTFTFSPDSGCNPLTVTFEASSLNADNFYWDLGNGNVIEGNDTITYTYTQEGLYTPILVLSSTLSNGSQCLLPATTNGNQVEVVNIIDIQLSQNSLLLWEDSTITVNALINGGVTPYDYYWSPNNEAISCIDCLDPIFTGTGTSYYYYFNVTDSNGCKGIDTLFVESKFCTNPENTPNIFSPNGDGRNDIFYIPGICKGETVQMDIFDRWGILMFSTEARKEGWDGRTTAGVEANEGTYYFVVKLKDSNYKGFILLTR
jgi:gliding motility-associated-like protein